MAIFLWVQIQQGIYKLDLAFITTVGCDIMILPLHTWLSIGITHVINVCECVYVVVCVYQLWLFPFLEHNG